MRATVHDDRLEAVAGKPVAVSRTALIVPSARTVIGVAKVSPTNAAWEYLLSASETHAAMASAQLRFSGTGGQTVNGVPVVDRSPRVEGDLLTVWRTVETTTSWGLGFHVSGTQPFLGPFLAVAYNRALTDWQIRAITGYLARSL